MKLTLLLPLLAVGSAAIYSFVDVSHPEPPISKAASTPIAQSIPAARNAEPSHTQEDVLQRQIEDLQRRLAALDSRTARGAMPQPVVASAVHPDTEEQRDPQTRMEQQRRYHESMQQLAAAFERETVDRGWSDRTTAALRTTFGDGFRGGEMRSIDCRSTTCRIEIAEDNSGEFSKSMPLLALQLAQTLPNMSADRNDDGSGQSRTILYLTGARPSRAN